MRVLHVDAGRRWGGGQNQVRMLIRQLAARGIEQLCLCPLGSPLESRLRREGLPVEGVTWRSGSDPRAFSAIARTVPAWDLVHCHDAHAFQLALVPARFLRVPSVAARRVCFRTRAMKWNLATRVIAISDAVRATLLDSGVHEQRIRTIYSGIDLDEVAALEPGRPTLRERLGIQPGSFLAGNVGTLLEFKNQTLIPAAAACADGIVWAIIGDGPRRDEIRRSIDAHGVADRVHLSGTLPDARRFLRELDLFVFPSLGEALGTSVLDAMASRVPVIAADDAGPAEVLRPVHERTGASLYPPRDAHALAALANRVRRDAALRSAMIEHQLDRLQDFRIQRTAEDTLSVYHELVAR